MEHNMIFRILFYKMTKNGNKQYRVYGYYECFKNYFIPCSREIMNKYFTGSKWNPKDNSQSTLKTPDSIIDGIREKAGVKNIQFIVED